MRVIVSLMFVVGLTVAGFCVPWGDRVSGPVQAIAQERSEEVAVGEKGALGGPDNGELIVHEWGTFTSISGSDGSRLEFRPLIHNDLPGFVVNRAWQAGRTPNPFGKWDIRSLQRMGTPVTYFYTDREREIDVKVGFPKGLLTEFYPPVVAMKPEFDFKKRAEVGNSELDWGRLTLIPADRFLPPISSQEIAKAAQRRIVETLAPNSHSHPHYAYARETDSAFIHLQHKTDANRPLAPAGDHFEKFLFYRGVGNFPLPLAVVAKGNNEFEVTNQGSVALRSLFLVTFKKRNLDVQHVPSIDAGATITMTRSSGNTDFHRLAGMVQEALVREGLYEKEALAMVNTWRDSWFQEEGTRLFYMLPRELTDELLPLTISPAPDQVVRVMVGRMEILAPEEEARIAAIVRASAAARAAAAQKQVAEGEAPSNKQAPPPSKALHELGRFAEPALIRVKSFSKDDALRTEATILLNELQSASKSS